MYNDITLSSHGRDNRYRARLMRTCQDRPTAGHFRNVIIMHSHDNNVNNNNNNTTNTPDMYLRTLARIILYGYACMSFVDF